MSGHGERADGGEAPATSTADDDDHKSKASPSHEDPAKNDSDSDGDGAEEILEESPDKRWSKRREQVRQRDVPGIDCAYLAMDNETGNEVVWNEVQFSERRNFRDQEEKINAVFDNLTRLVHTNLVKFHKYWTDTKSEKPRIIFITEYMSSGSMSLFLQRTKKSGSPPSLKAWKKWTIQILCALRYLHTSEPAIVHGNLTCNTVFIQQNGLIKIGCVAPDAINHHVKTCRENIRFLHYIAPEIDSTGLTTASDVFAFGVCALEIAVAGLSAPAAPNGQQSEGVITTEILDKAVDSLEDVLQRDLIRVCLHPDPKKRPTAQQLLFHKCLFEVPSIKLIAATTIADSKLYANVPENVFRVTEVDKKVAFNSHHGELSYNQAPGFQVDLEKFVEEVKNGIHPITAWSKSSKTDSAVPSTASSSVASTATQPPREVQPAVPSQPTPTPDRPATATKTKSSPAPAEKTAPPPPEPTPQPSSAEPETVTVAVAPPEDVVEETRQVLNMGGRLEGRELTLRLQLDDSMNRQLTTVVQPGDSAQSLAHSLVDLGFVSSSDFDSTVHLLETIMRRAAEWQSTETPREEEETTAERKTRSVPSATASPSPS